MEHKQFNLTNKNIWNAFFELLKQEKFTAITVGQICNIAKISRTTFYRHYVDKYALLNNINRYYSHLLACFLKERLDVLDIKQILMKIAQFLSENSTHILFLLDIHTPESDLSELFKETLHNEFTNFINNGQFSIKMSKFPKEYLIDLYVAVSLVFLYFSLENGPDVNVINYLNNLQNTLFY